MPVERKTTHPCGRGPLLCPRVFPNRSPLCVISIDEPLQPVGNMSGLASTRLVHAPLLNWSNRLSNLPISTTPPQAAWLLLVHCAAARANYVARVVEPGSAEHFCRRHDAGLWQCLCTILQISPNQGEDVVGAASMPLVLGGLGLRSACRVSQPAYWASWADALHVIHNRHPEVAAQLVTALDDEPESRSLCAEKKARKNVEGVMGFESWQAAAAGARPEAREPKLLPASSRTGAGIGEVPSRFWSRDGVDSCSNESGDHDPISFVSRDSPPPSSPGPPVCSQLPMWPST